MIVSERPLHPRACVATVFWTLGLRLQSIVNATESSLAPARVSG